MVVTAIISFATSGATDPIIEKLITALNGSVQSPPFVIGTKVQEPNTVQITSSCASIESPNALQSLSQYQAFTETIHGIVSSSLISTIADLATSTSSENNAPLPFTEWVKVDFPSSDTTAPFRARIEDDFARFESMFRQRGRARELGEGELSTGWTEEQDGVMSFVVSRGWERMSAFDTAVGTDAFKQAVGILMGWGAPFNLWHVETKLVVSKRL